MIFTKILTFILENGQIAQEGGRFRSEMSDFNKNLLKQFGGNIFNKSRLYEI